MIPTNTIVVMTTASKSINFYQSTLRKHINADIFCKPCFTINYQWVDYQVVCKEKYTLWWIVVWYQILWVHSRIFADTQSVDLFKQCVVAQAHNYYKWKKFLSLFIQCGFTNILVENSVWSIKHNEQEITEQFQSIKNQINTTYQSLWLKPAHKHNLPDATIIIDLDQSIEHIRSDIGKNTKEKIKKTEKMIKQGELVHSLANSLDEVDLFYKLYTKTAETKWFGSITTTMREKLKQSAINEWFGRVFLIKNTIWEVISGAFCIGYEDTLIYLYGANDHQYGNKGVSQYLHRMIIQYAKVQWYSVYDFLWVSWLWSTNDRLAKVTQFKMGFGGAKLEYGGSWDIPLHSVGYRVYTWL